MLTLTGDFNKHRAVKIATVAAPVGVCCKCHATAPLVAFGQCATCDAEICAWYYLRAPVTSPAVWLKCLPQAWADRQAALASAPPCASPLLRPTKRTVTRPAILTF